MSINDNMNKLRNGYIAGKSAFQSDEDRGEEFDATMKEDRKSTRLNSSHPK